MGGVTARSALIHALRTLAGAVTLLAIAGLAATWLAATPVAPPARILAGDSEAARSLEAIQRAFGEDLDALRETARAVAADPDTIEFATRPNIPYALEHFKRGWLAAERVDTVLIIDARRAPLFWRRADARRNRGFPDAKAFLKRLPPLPASVEAGAAALAGALPLARAPAFVVAMPIVAAPDAAPRGWLVLARTLGPAAWHGFGERAHADVDVVAPLAEEWPSEAPATGEAPVAVVRTEPTRVRGWLAVYDLKGAPLKLYAVSLPRAPAAAPVAAPATVGRNARWLGATALVAGLLTLLLTFIPRRRDEPLESEAGEPAELVAYTAPSARSLVSVATIVGSAPQRAAAAPLSLAPLPAQPRVPEAPPAVAANGSEDGDVEVTIDTDDGATSQPGERLEIRAASGKRGRQRPDPAAGRLAAIGERLGAARCDFRYQPQVNLQRDRIVGVESLLCLQERGCERPALEFIDSAETDGLGLDLTECWLRSACGERQVWLREVGGAFPVSVPVRRAALEDPGFLPMLKRVLSKTELAPWLLELEVDESMFSSQAASRVLAEVHRTGVLLCIDSFGQALSSLKSLAVVPVAKLRIDAALISTSAHDDHAAALVLAIVGAARGLGIAVCATGVDSLREASTLEAHGRLLVQGVALGAPMDSAQFLALLRGRGIEPAMPAEGQAPRAARFGGGDGAQA